MNKKHINKYLYLWVIQGDYGEGWEDLCQSVSYRESRIDLKAYRENEIEYSHRMIYRRELNLKKGGFNV